MIFSNNIVSTLFLLDLMYITPVERVVTELKDQIVCAQIANDEIVWKNMKYSPIDGNETHEDIYD